MRVIFGIILGVALTVGSAYLLILATPCFPKIPTLNAQWSIGTLLAPSGTISPKKRVPNGRGSPGEVLILVADLFTLAHSECVSDSAAVHSRTVIPFNEQRNAAGLLQMTRP